SPAGTLNHHHHSVANHIAFTAVEYSRGRFGSDGDFPGFAHDIIVGVRSSSSSSLCPPHSSPFLVSAHVSTSRSIVRVIPTYSSRRSSSTCSLDFLSSRVKPLSSVRRM